VPSGWIGSDGLLNIVAVATAANGEWTMALDTVQVLDEPGVGRAWFTNSSRYDQAKASADAAATEARAAGGSTAASQTTLTTAAADDEASAVADGERAATLKMTFAAPAKQSTASSGGSFSAASVDPMPGYSCYTDANLGQQVSNRSFFETQTVAYYEMWTNYMSSKSTAFSVGVSANGSSGWSLAGTETIGSSTGVSLIDHLYSDANTAYKARVHVGVIHAKYRWQCFAYGGGTHIGTVYTVEPVGLNGGHSYVLGTPSVGCNPTYKAEISPNGTTHRLESSSEANGYMASIWGFSAGQTTTFRQSVDVSWTNHSVYTRYLCGESNYVPYKTRVSAIS
jgi:hypothetical protein